MNMNKIQIDQKKVAGSACKLLK